MKELLKKLMEAGKKDALNSMDELVSAAKEIGYTEEEVNAAMDGFDGFPLDDDDLDEVTGGLSLFRTSSTLNRYDIKDKRGSK